MLLDRTLQYRILLALQDVYPDSVLVSALPFYEESRRFMANLFYLKEQGFLTGGDVREPGRYRSMVDIEITKDGLDFLADDGGIPTVLDGTRIVIESSDLLAFIQQRIQASTGNDEEKRKLGAWVEGLTMTELQDLLMVLLEAGLDQPADVLAIMERALGGGAQ